MPTHEEHGITIARLDERMKAIAEDQTKLSESFEELAKSNQRIALVEQELVNIRRSQDALWSKLHGEDKRWFNAAARVGVEIIKLTIAIGAAILLNAMHVKPVDAQEIAGSTAVLSLSPDYHLTTSAGVSYQSKPEIGTWWDQPYPHNFTQIGNFVSIGMTGPHWSVELADLGRETVYCLCNGVPYSGSQHPRGLWASFEPDFAKVFLRLGGGVYRLDFKEYVPSAEVGNNRFAIGYLAGAGYRFGRFDAIADIRYIGAYRPLNEPGDFPAIGKFGFAVYVRGRM